MGPLTMPLILEALGLQLVVEIDPDATARITSKLPRREVVTSIQAVKVGRGKKRLVSKRHLRKIAPMGGRARMEKLTADQRSAHARAAVMARWGQKAA